MEAHVFIGRLHSKHLYDIVNDKKNQYFTYQNTIHLQSNNYYCAKWCDIIPNITTKHEKIDDDIYVCKIEQKN